MKKSKLILLTLLGLLFFNSCKDEEVEKPSPYQTITTLKSITGISFEEAQVKLGNLGYAFSESQTPSQDFIIHTFESNFNSNKYLILEANNKIFNCAYIAAADKNLALNGFEKYSAECIAYMTGKAHQYKGVTSFIEEEESTFATHQEFANYYVANKYDLQTCIEAWETNKDGVSSQYSVPNIISESFMSILIYADFEYTPESMLNKDLILKNILSTIK